MAKVKLFKTEHTEQYYFECPACGIIHAFDVVNDYRAPGDVWQFNGDVNNPTFSPSLLVLSDNSKYRCHSFVRNGNIEFLSDCSHEYAGKTIELKDKY